MIDFPDHRDCTDCMFCQRAENPGIPTRVYKANGHDKALLFVGMAPGYHEDKAGRSWVGWSGTKLGKFIDAIKFPELVDVYLSNAMRCWVPHKQKPNKTEINACRPHLLVDIQRLLDNYKEVVIFALGADAAKTVAGVSSLGEGLKLQGLTEGVASLGILSRMPTLFFTNHPAILAPGRKPERVNVIQSHFMLVRRYLMGKFIPNKLQVVPEVGEKVPEVIPDRVTCDIETYGILKGFDQTVFTPAKSRYVDGVPYGKQVVTVSFAYRDAHFSPCLCKIRTPVYIFSDSNHRKLIREWMMRVIKAKAVLQGQNFKYDLLYLIMNDPGLSMLLDPNKLRIDDTLIKTFLLDEAQPEKGLKELALLYGIANYRELSVTGSKGNAKNSSDPELLYYNCLDAAATLVLGEETDERIRIRYGQHTKKLKPVCAKMRNDVLWDVIGLERAGQRIDIPKLEAVNTEYKYICDKTLEMGDARDIIFAGTGSKKPRLEFMMKSVEECGLLGDTRVERTKVKKEISVNKANVNLILQYLPEGELRWTAETMKVYAEYSHLKNTYTNKLLTHPREGIIYRKYGTGHMYPVWYPVPSVFEKGGTKNKEKKGGTIQGRITPRKPPAQTFPRPVKACMKSRFPGGTLRTYDFSQIEMRMAALLSGCPVLMGAYLTPGRSVHLDTTFMLYPHLKKLTKDEVKEFREYTSCKSLNFLVIFRGGPVAYQMTARSDCGLEIPIEQCKAHIDTWYAGHPVFRAWQDSQIALVAEQGYLELPTGWSRTFGTGMANAMGAMKEICNFPIQTLGSGQIPESSQFVIMQGLIRSKMRAVVCGNKYDSITVDTPYYETEAVDELVDGAMKHPPLMKILEQELGRTIPIEYERKVQ